MRFMITDYTILDDPIVYFQDMITKNHLVQVRDYHRLVIVDTLKGTYYCGLTNTWKVIKNV